MVKHIAVLGSQWGDEGKGKIVDYLSEKLGIGMIVRCQGGDNAGHTVVLNELKLVLHQIPSGILTCPKNLIGVGQIVNLDSLMSEMEDLENSGFLLKDKLFISDRAKINLPVNILIDIASEASSSIPIGTTLRGIGPAYSDKFTRKAITIAQLLFLSEEQLKEKINFLIDNAISFISKVCNQTPWHIMSYIRENEDRKKMSEKFMEEYFDMDNFVKRDKIIDNLLNHRNKIREMVVNGSKLINEFSRKEKILFEGAQGLFLDIDYGTYPYCTSSNTGFGGLFSGTGFSGQIDERIGIVKAYTTRVGKGPFPTEQNNEFGNELKDKGKEFGATTGRPRRCGWLDLVMLKHSHLINGYTQLAITKLDVLDNFKKIRICIGYRKREKIINDFPSCFEELAECEPIYEELEGWMENTKGIQEYHKLPRKAKDYLNFIESHLGVPIALISTSPKREDVILLRRIAE